MKIFSTFLKVYLSAFFILFIAVGMTNGKTVLNSIVPSMRAFDIVEINIKQIKVADGKKDNFLTKSIRPIYRKQDNGKLVRAPKLPEEDATKVKSNKVSRIYIMGKTVPIFRSVIPKIKPI